MPKKRRQEPTAFAKQARAWRESIGVPQRLVGEAVERTVGGYGDFERGTVQEPYDGMQRRLRELMRTCKTKEDVEKAVKQLSAPTLAHEDPAGYGSIDFGTSNMPVAFHDHPKHTGPMDNPTIYQINAWATKAIDLGFVDVARNLIDQAKEIDKARTHLRELVESVRSLKGVIDGASSIADSFLGPDKPEM